MSKSQFIIEFDERYECPLAKYISYCGLNNDVECDGFYRAERKNCHLKKKRLETVTSSYVVDVNNDNERDVYIRKELFLNLGMKLSNCLPITSLKIPRSVSNPRFSKQNSVSYSEQELREVSLTFLKD